MLNEHLLNKFPVIILLRIYEKYFIVTSWQIKGCQRMFCEVQNNSASQREVEVRALKNKQSFYQFQNEL